MRTIETDYLVVGAGATGMAFTDSLVADSDAQVVMVDRRHRPGGHWNDAYPFVRLHQPSAYYGVNSLPLGQDRIDADGPNAGGYDRADASEICAYFQRVLDEVLLESGRVRFLGMTDHLPDGSGRHVLRSRLTGDETEVRVRRRLVDATFLEGDIPSRHARRFEVEDGVRVIPPNDLVTCDTSDGAVSGFTVIGSGKTGMDSCTWLLEQGVPPEMVRWVKPREAWLYDRALTQPRELVASIIDGVALELQAAAEAEDPQDLMSRLESCGRLMRVDAGVEPTMFRAATLSRREADRLRSIEDVVRKGRVMRVERDRLVLAEGEVPSDPGRLHVDCTASGLPHSSPRPIFEDDRVTVQTVRIGLTPFNAAMVGYVEATRDDTAEKNRLCPANHYPSTALDWLPTTYTSTVAEGLWGEQPDIAEWLERSRLNLASGLRDHIAEPRMQDAITRLLTFREPALENMRLLMKATGHDPVPPA